MNSFQSTTRLALSALAIFCAAGSAHAVGLRVVTTPGAACKLSGAATGPTLKDIESRRLGTTNRNPDSARIIVCPISTSNLDGGADTKVQVFGSIKGGRSISCTIESLNSDGAVIATRSFNRTGTGSSTDVNPFSNAVDFTASEMPDTSYMSMACQMPASQGATIFTIKTVALEQDK